MGTCFYLIRRDTRTAYDLGKASFLRDAIGEEVPTRVSAGDADTMLALVLAAKRGDLRGRHDVTLHRRPDTEDEDYAYWRAVVLDVVDWSEGQSFELHSEHSELYEEISMDGWRDSPRRERLFITGDRHDRHAAPAAGDGARWPRSSRGDLARRRRDDVEFRMGCVWARRGDATGTASVRS